MSSAGSHLAGLTRDLWANWQRTKESWNDVKSREFEQKYLLELLSTVDRTVATIDQLDVLISRIRKDCE
jgi:thymidylate synthase